MKIALLGSIPKGDDVRSGWVDWKTAYIDVLSSEIPAATFIDGDAISDNAGSEMVVGHDLSLIKAADICVVDAQDKIGAGTAQEMVVAKYFQKPVVIVIPPDSHHRKSDITFHGVTMPEWIHPFLVVSSDYVASSIEDAAVWIRNYSATPQDYKIKDMSVYETAIEHFESSEFAK